MSSENKNFNLGPGEYKFRHLSYGDVRLTVGQNSLDLHGERKLDGGSSVQTLGQGAHGVTLSDALNALPRNLKALLRNYQSERDVVNEGEVVYVHDMRAGMSTERRRNMSQTGEVPTERRIFKSDAF